MISMLAKLGIFAFALLNGINNLRPRCNSNISYKRVLATPTNNIYSLRLKRSSPVGTRYTRNPKQLQQYIEQNVLTSFTLYTIVNECCRAIIIYHNKFAEHHGNTSLANFKLKNDLQCIYLDSSTNISTGFSINNTTKYADYDTFFASYSDALMNKNKHFLNIYELYKRSFYKSIL